MACISAVFYDIICRHGRLAERSKAAVLKTVDAKVSGGSNPSPSAIKRQHPLPFFELNQMRNFRGINRLWIMLDKNAKLVYIIKEVCWCACSSVQRFYQPNTIILPTLIYCRYNYGRKI